MTNPIDTAGLRVMVAEAQELSACQPATSLMWAWSESARDMIDRLVNNAEGLIEAVERADRYEAALRPFAEMAAVVELRPKLSPGDEVLKLFTGLERNGVRLFKILTTAHFRAAAQALRLNTESEDQ